MRNGSYKWYKRSAIYVPNQLTNIHIQQHSYKRYKWFGFPKNKVYWFFLFGWWFDVKQKNHGNDAMWTSDKWHQNKNWEKDRKRERDQKIIRKNEYIHWVQEHFRCGHIDWVYFIYLHMSYPISCPLLLNWIVDGRKLIRCWSWLMNDSMDTIEIYFSMHRNHIFF